jgi:uncharacterized membrane protein YgaE (UPF0421/DUF939 family)
MATHRSILARELKGWLKSPPQRWLTRYPLMPEASAKLMFAIRGAIVLTGCAAFMLARDTHSLLNGEILIPVAAIVAVQHTVGATIQTGVRLFWAAFAATCFSLIWISIFPRSNYSGVCGVSVAAFIFSVLECSVPFKRFAMAGVIVSLLVWSDNPDTGYSLPLEVGLSTLFGTILGIIVIAFPLPHAVTVTREIGTRLRLVAHGMRNQMAAVALAFTHELPEELQGDFRARMQDLAVDVTDEIYGTATPHLSPVAVPKEDMSVGRPQDVTPPPELLRAQSMRYDEFDFDPSEHVEFTERAPLLRADIADMNTRTSEHMAFIETALGALPWEVSSMWVVCAVSTRRGWNALMRAIVCCCCWRLFQRLGCKPLCVNYWCYRPTSSTPRAPLSVKDTLHLRLRRWVSAATRLHRITQAIMVAEKNSRPSFVHHRFVKLMANPLCRLVLAIGTHFDRCISFAARQHYECMGQPFPLFLNAEWTGYAGDPCPTFESMARSRADVNDALVGFLVSFRQARHAIMYKKGKREWHAADLFAVNAFHFLVLRFVQTTLFAEGETISLDVPTIPAIASQLYVASPILPLIPLPRLDGHITHVAGVDNNNDDDGEADLEGVQTPITGTRAGFGAGELSPPATPPSNTPIGATAPRARPPQQQHHLCTCRSFWPCSARNILRIQRQCGRPATWRGSVLRLAAGLAYQIGFLPTRIAFKRALRVTLSVGIAAILGIVLAPVLNSSGFAYWAPISCAFMSGGSDGGTFKASTLRLMGTLIGATYGYFAVRIVEGNDIAIGVLTVLWVAVMQFPRCDPVNGQWALVAAFTAAIVMLNSGGTSFTAQSLALTRIEQTVLGIIVFILVHNLVFPVRANSLVKRRIETSVVEIRDAVCSTLNQLTRFVTHEVAYIRAVDAARTDTPPRPPPPYTPLEDVKDTTERLGGVEKALASLPDLMSEASMEPHWSAHGFELVKPHYVELGAACDRAVRAIRILNQCFLALHGQSLLYHKNQAPAEHASTVDPRQLTTLAHLVVAHHQGDAGSSSTGNGQGGGLSADARSILSFYPMLDALQSLAKRLHTVLDTVVAAIDDDKVIMDVGRSDNDEIAHSISSAVRRTPAHAHPSSIQYYWRCITWSNTFLYSMGCPWSSTCACGSHVGLGTPLFIVLLRLYACTCRGNRVSGKWDKCRWKWG